MSEEFENGESLGSIREKLNNAIKELNGLPNKFISKDEYNYGGKFATIAAANLAIKNELVAGKNRRDGTRVDIGSAGSYVTYWWKGGYADGNLVEYFGDVVKQADFDASFNRVLKLGVETPVIGASASLRTIWFQNKIQVDSTLVKVKIAVAAVSSLALKRYKVSSDGLQYLFQAEINIPLQAGYNSVNINPFKFFKDELIAAYCTSPITNTTETAWSTYRYGAVGVNVSSNTTIASLPLDANTFNRQIGFEFKDLNIIKNGDIVNDLTSGGVSVPLSAEQGKNLNLEVTPIAIKNKAGALANLKPTARVAYTDFPLGSIDGPTGLISTSGPNATRRHSGFTQIPAGVTEIIFMGFNTGYRYQFYDNAGLPIFPNSVTNTNIPTYAPVPTGATQFIVNVYNSSFPGVDYSTLFYGYKTASGFPTLDYVEKNFMTLGGVSDLEKLFLQHSRSNALTGSNVPVNIDTWQNYSDGGLVPIANSEGIRLLDNVSTLETQAKIRNMLFQLSDRFTVFIKMQLVQLNSSYNMDALSGTSSDGYGETTQTGDDSINKSGFSFAIVHPTLDIRPIFSIVKAQDYATSSKIEIWRITPGGTGMKAGFERVYSGTDLKLNEVFTLEINYTLSGLQYLVSIKKNGLLLVNSSLMGMVSNYGGYGSLLFQCKGTVEEPAEYIIKGVTMLNKRENGNFLSEIITRLL